VTNSVKRLIKIKGLMQMINEDHPRDARYRGTRTGGLVFAKGTNMWACDVGRARACDADDCRVYVHLVNRIASFACLLQLFGLFDPVFPTSASHLLTTTTLYATWPKFPATSACWRSSRRARRASVLVRTRPPEMHIKSNN
jgi:hypothetical protein